MNRRSLLRDTAVAAMGLFASKILSAEESCVPLTPYLRRCTAGIPSNLIGVQAYQQMPQWCWAACIEMVFTYWGHPVSQQRIVKETWGAVVNMPGQPYQILADLNRAWKDDNGRGFRSTGDMLSANPSTAVLDLRQNRPLLVGALGHATVLTALTSDVNNVTGAWNVIGATVRDPWPGNGGRRLLSPQEWYNINFAARVLVSSVNSEDDDSDN